MISCFTRPSGRAIVVAGLLATAPLQLVACGGDSRRATEPSLGETVASQTAAGPTVNVAGAVVATPVSDPARRAYIARVDAVCRQLDPERTKERDGATGDIAQVASRYELSIGLSSQELRRILAITPPTTDVHSLRANVFSVITRQIAIRQEIHAALLARNLATLQARQAQLDDLTRSLAGFARGYGFQICGTSGWTR